MQVVNIYNTMQEKSMKTEWKAGDIWTVADQQELQDAYDKLIPIDELPEGKSVRFLNKGYPILAFKKVYPTNKVVKQGEDVVIIKRSELCYDNGLRRDIRNTPWNATVPVDLKLEPDYKVGDPHWTTKGVNNKYIDYQVLSGSLNKSFIYEESLKTYQEYGTMTRKNYDRLLEYLKSTDKETFNMGWGLMFNYDYDSSKELFALLLAQAKHSWNHKTPQKVLWKTVLKKARRDFPGIK